MKPYFGMSLNPSDYAWELVQRLGFKEPSINWVDIVLEHLGLTKRPYSGSPFFPSLEGPETTHRAERQMKLLDNEPGHPATAQRQRRPVDAALQGTTVFVDSDFPPQRQRLAICHEIGHHYLPWHKGLTYWKNGCFVEPPGAGQYESQAHRFAADLLMPPAFFRPDMDGLDFGLRSLEALSGR